MLIWLSLMMILTQYQLMMPIKQAGGDGRHFKFWIKIISEKVKPDLWNWFRLIRAKIKKECICVWRKCSENSPRIFVDPQRNRGLEGDGAACQSALDSHHHHCRHSIPSGNMFKKTVNGNFLVKGRFRKRFFFGKGP